MDNFAITWIRSISITILLVLVQACTHIGPETVRRDRFDYNTAISDSWKEQTLLNIVKLRYADMPLFVEVASIVSGYTIESTVNLGSSLVERGNNIFSLGGSGKYTDRPTITYSPITGEKFNKNFMTPIPPAAIFFLLQSGWSAEVIFPLTVDSVSGIRSQISAGANQRVSDKRFAEVVRLIRLLQKSGKVGMQIKSAPDKKDKTVIFFYRDDSPPEVQSALAQFFKLLNLDPTAQEFKISYGMLSKNTDEISMLTRSMLQIMVELASQIDVPMEHIKDGITIPSLINASNNESAISRLINVHYSSEKPDNAFVSVKYHDYWFYIDDRDFKSKRTFAILMIMFSLTETGAKQGMPLITIPAG